MSEPKPKRLPGRPTKASTRASAIVTLRITPERKGAITEAAKRNGKSTTEFLLDCADPRINPPSQVA